MRIQAFVAALVAGAAQGRLRAEGNVYLNKDFPNLGIESATIAK
jgi:hypothetical protein